MPKRKAKFTSATSIRKKKACASETPQQRTERQCADAERATLYRHRLAQATQQHCCTACDDIQYFNEAWYTVSHRLGKISLFECPTCSFCGAYSWKREKSFCCSSGCVDICYDPENPKPGSIS